MTAINRANSYKNNIIVTDNGKKYKKATFWETAGAVVVANTASTVVMNTVKRLHILPLKRLNTVIKQENQQIYKSAIDEVVKKTGLDKNGLKILDATEENKLLVKDALIESLPSNIQKLYKKNTGIKNYLDNYLLNKMTKILIKGKNAVHIIKTGTIILNKDLMSTAAFHEMGHYINRHKSVAGKILNSLRIPATFVTCAAVTCALFKRKKADGEKTTGLFDKSTTFIKNNCTKLAFISTLPVLLEEGLASINAAKIAKKALAPAYLNKMNKFNTASWITYLGTTIGVTASTAIVSQIMDRLSAPKEIKD